MVLAGGARRAVHDRRRLRYAIIDQTRKEHDGRTRQLQPRRPRRRHPGRRRRHRLGAGRGLRRGRRQGRRGRPDAGVARRDGRAGASRRRRGPRGRRRRDRRGRQRAAWSRRRSSASAASTSSSTPSVAAPARRSTPPRPIPRSTGTGSWTSTCGARSCRPRPSSRQMIAQGDGGRILNISSVRANLGINAGYSAYVAAKGAISSLTRQWATEWAQARHPGQRDHADLRRHAPGRDAARGPGVQGRHRRAGSRSAGSARRATSSARRSSSCSDAASFVTGPDPGHRRRPDGDPVMAADRPRARHAERLHDDQAARLQPELRRRPRTASSPSTRRSCRRGRSRCARRPSRTARSATSSTPSTTSTTSSATTGTRACRSSTTRACTTTSWTRTRRSTRSRTRSRRSRPTTPRRPRSSPIATSTTRTPTRARSCSRAT